MLFFATGLELGMWMTAASLAGWWLWWCGAIKRLGSLSFGAVLLPILFVTTIFCRSTGAMTLLGAGIALLWISVRFRTRLLLAAVLLAPPLYVGVRTANLWSGQQAVDLTTSLVDAERAESLAYRFMCENLLMKRALQRPVWGWSGWDRSAVYFNENKPWKKRVATDGVWITALGSGGYVGLVLLYLSIAVPVARFLWRFPPRLWALPEMAAASLASVLLSLYMIDCLMNAFINIIYLTLAGGLNSFDFTQLQAITPYPVGLGGAATRREPLSARHVATTAGIRAIDLAEQGHSRGRVLKAAGQFKEAQSAWRQTLDLLNPLLESHPEQPDLWLRWGDCGNDLAWLWANSPDLNERDPDAAVEMARQIVEKFPDVATYWNTLGAAYYRAGDDRSAVAALNRAMALGGGTAFDDVFMAMAQARLGNQQGARRALALAQFRSERDCPWHPELIILCTEARSVVVDFTEAPTTAVDHQS
jgi:tetratricopeptide (TPR) repeat protein